MNIWTKLSRTTSCCYLSKSQGINKVRTCSEETWIFLQNVAAAWYFSLAKVVERPNNQNYRVLTQTASVAKNKKPLHTICSCDRLFQSFSKLPNERMRWLLHLLNTSTYLISICQLNTKTMRTIRAIISPSDSKRICATAPLSKRQSFNEHM